MTLNFQLVCSHNLKHRPQFPFWCGPCPDNYDDDDNNTNSGLKNNLHLFLYIRMYYWEGPGVRFGLVSDHRTGTPGPNFNNRSEVC
jgi:hypothetical protein